MTSYENYHHSVPMKAWEMEDMEVQKISLVAPGMYITGIDGAKRKHALIDRGITHIVTILCKGDPCTIDPMFNHFRLNADDNYHQDIIPIAKEAHAYIMKAKEEGGIVLTHCAAGVSRSVSVVLYHLMQLDPKLTLDEALRSIRQTRPVAHPNYVFMNQLRNVSTKSEFT